MKISLFKDGYQNVISTETVDDWAEFVDLVIQPQLGQKNGAYFVRGFCAGARADENMQSIGLIIIDGDQLLDNGHTCCPPAPVHEVMVRANITHVIYSSYSNDLINNLHKFRLCIPSPDIVDAETLIQGVSEVITLLQQNGINIRNVKENNVLSQPWFLPRCPDEGRLLDFYYAYHDGRPWTMTGQVIDSARISYEAKEAPNSEAGHFSMEFVIDQFRAGTLHQGIKSLCGWYIRTTDWQDSQIKAHLAPIIRATCPDMEKVARACEGKEIDQLIKYCRQKSGSTEYSASWKDVLINAKELREKEFPPIKWAVDDIIPEGLTILAGEPKVGKSLLAVDICSSIAAGSEAFGVKACTKGSAVYLSMEDPERRIQGRIRSQCDVWPETFKMVTTGIPELGKSFFDVIDEMCMLWPDMRAIIVDTMAFIIPAKKNGVSDYEHYYSCLHPAHQWAINNHIALIMITHLNKNKLSDGDNPFSGIMGSQAIAGTADAMILLKKNHAKTGLIKGDNSIHDGQLIITGREIGAQTINLEFEEYSLRWMFSDGYKIPEQVQGAQPLIVCKELEKKPMDTKRLAAVCGLKDCTVRMVCNRLKTKKIVNKDETGEWFLVGKEYQETPVNVW